MKPIMDIRAPRKKSMLAIAKEQTKALPKSLDNDQAPSAQVTSETPTQSEAPIRAKKIKPKIPFFVLFLGLVMVIGGLLATYRYLPAFSIQVLTLKSGVKARYPEYRPVGYSWSKPAWQTQPDEILIEFKKSPTAKIILKQKTSNWDSSAVKQHIEDTYSQKIITTNEKGLTIFTWDNHAMWVNGGILYSILSDEHLPADQIRRIATSL